MVNLISLLSACELNVLASFPGPRLQMCLELYCISNGAHDGKPYLFFRSITRICAVVTRNSLQIRKQAELDSLVFQCVMSSNDSVAKVNSARDGAHKAGRMCALCTYMQLQVIRPCMVHMYTEASLFSVHFF